MNPKKIFLFVLIALSGGVFSSAALAQSAIRSSTTGFCMDVFNGSSEDRAGIIQWDCVNQPNQRWTATAAGIFNSYKAQGSGLCLEVPDASIFAGTPLVQRPCTGAANQQFYPRPQGDGVALTAKHSNMCVGMASTAKGAQLQQQSCTGVGNQTWVIGEVAIVSPPPAANGAIQSLASNLCVDVFNASQTPGTALVQYACGGSDNQKWQVVGSAGGFSSLKVAHSGQCMDVPSGAKNPGAALAQYTCNGYENQQFAIAAQGAGVKITARHSGLCVGVEDGSTASLARITQQTCNGSAAQTWKVAGAAPTTGGGSWSPSQKMSLVPVAAANLPDGKVLTWSASGRLTYTFDSGKTFTSTFDPVAGTFSEAFVTESGHEMFCPGISNLPDGRIFVSGGSDAPKVSSYSPATGKWSAAPKMNGPRGYHSTVTLGNGDVFTIGGSWSGGVGFKDAELWSYASNSWRRLSNLADDFILTGDAKGVYRSDNHAWLFSASNGSVFHAGPSKRMNWFSMAGNGGGVFAGNRAADGDSMNGNATMFDIDRILTVGGAPNYDDSNATSAAHVINIAGGNAAVKKIGSMAYTRAFHSSVALPDGKVLVAGGQAFAKVFSDDGAVLVPELFDPKTETFTKMAPMAEPRTYHSLALLLADGRVMVGGGGLCGTCTTNHATVEVFSPPYLFNANGTPATRPVLRTAPAQATAGTSITVTADSEIAAFSLMRLSSVTHSVNNEQRRVPVNFAATGVNQYALALPANRNVLVPGYYMLFGLNRAGVPSVSRSILVN